MTGRDILLGGRGNALARGCGLLSVQDRLACRPGRIAVAWALASIGEACCCSSCHSSASPRSRRSWRRWSDGLPGAGRCARRFSCLGSRSSVGAALLVLVQAMVDSVRSFSDSIRRARSEVPGTAAGQPHQRRQRLARDAESACRRHHERGRQGVGRCGARRGIGLRSRDAHRVGRLPDAVRPDR